MLGVVYLFPAHWQANFHLAPPHAPCYTATAMRKQISFLHTAYQKALPLCIRTALGKTRNRMKILAWKIQNLILRENHEERWAKIRRRVSSQKAYRARLAKLRALLGKKAGINVAFEVTGISKWKADSLLRLMIQHPRFNPIMWHVPYAGAGGPARHQQELAECREYFTAIGAKLVAYASLADFPEAEKPDIVFPNEPYDEWTFAMPHNKGLLKFLWCFIPYDYASTVCRENKDQIITNGALFEFYENDATARAAARIMTNGGVNAVVTGHAMADAYLFPPQPRPAAWKACQGGMKRIIWAPHWTVCQGMCRIAFGTFLETGEILLEMAEKYRERIQFAFKPHPNLYYTLCEHPQWGKERADTFYAKWREMPNTQFEDGAYADLFMQSDAMIHDCGSFMLEYLYADKPCMYLKAPENRQEYSAMAEDCLNAYQLGITREEIEAFLQMVLRGEDPKAGVRRQLREKYLIPPHGQSAAQNIIDCLLMQEHHD